ncbi:MAG: TonB-dependent receptor [Pseudomonadota bacterium]
MNWKTLAGGVAFGAMAAAIVQPADAQITSSSINGTVVNEAGQAVSGAAVTILHEPTGSVSTTTTSPNGSFVRPGLRVGGPYLITIESPVGSVRRGNIFLTPSSNSLSFSVAAVDEARTLETIVVRGEVGSTLDVNNGIGSVFTDSDILGQPSTERDLIATLVRDPLAFSTGEGQIQIAGVNPRFNALAIDGSLQQDDFGLSDSTYATARAPISLDAIESASVAASDYDVKSSGFVGGLVNVVTKSGTNEFDGALYYYRQDEDYFGNAAFDQFVEQPAFTEEEYGFVLSGPIIKDKLFFMVSYDEFESGSSSNFTQSDIDDDINPAIYDGINQIVLDTYGFDLGGRPDVVSLPVTSERFLGKIDWEINENHRASFTYQSTEENGTSGVGQTNFQSAYYQTPTDLKAYTAQVFSDWSPQLSTEFRINFKDYERGQLCNAGDTVGAWDIQLSEADLVGTAFEGFLDDGDADPAETADTLFLTGGCDRFRQGNTFADERLQILGAANYVLGDHFITVGAEFQDYELDNLFAQRSVGLFRYESIADLQAGFADRVQVQLPDTGVREDIRAVWGYNQIALFAQDSWQILPNFSLDYGIRYERIVQDDEPQERTFFQDAYGFSNSQNLDGNDLIMPRVSFEYTPFDRTKVTGGFGLFGGGDPKVWTSNAFTPPVFFAQEFGVANTNPANGTPASLLATITANSANDPGPIDVISNDFETPSDWKASLRVDQEFDADLNQFGIPVNFGDDYLISLQALYSATNQGFRWENLAQTELASTQPVGVAPDGRPIYADLDDLGINNAIALTNYDDGSSLTLSAALSKDYDNGLGFFASYAYQDVETVTEGGSSRGVSNFRGIFASDRNNPSAGTSVYQTEHAFKLNLSYEAEIFGDLESRFNLFGQVTSGEPFSYTFDVSSDNSLFGRQGDGESPFDNDFLYVPTISGGAISDPAVVVASSFQEDAFIDYLNSRGIGSGIQDKGDDESPWNSRWDFQWQQELPFVNEFASQYVGDNKLKFVVDVKNVANLLNDEWGTQFNGPGFDALGIVRADLVSAADVAANGVDGATALEGDAPRTTCLSAGDCLYRFEDFDDDPSGFRSLNRSVYEIRVGLRYEF